MSSELAAYFDDSGHPDDQDAVVVAGWVAKVDQWYLWEQGWKKVLADYGIKSGIFHMADFEAAAKTADSHNEYSDMSAQERIVFRDKLMNLIATRARSSFCSLIPMRDYKEVNEEYYFEEWLGKPYAFAAISVMQKLRAWKKQYAPSDPLVTFFEDGTKHKGDLMSVFKQFRFDTPIFVKKSDVTPLQAADYIAWECFNTFRTGDVRPAFKQLIYSTMGADKHGMFTSERLIEACNDISVPKRDPNKPRAFCYTSSPKVRRFRQIVEGPRDGQIKGIDRIGKTTD